MEGLHERCAQIVATQDARAVKDMLSGATTRRTMLYVLAVSPGAPHAAWMGGIDFSFPGSLHVAAQGGCIAYIDMCLMHHDINELWRGNTALWNAAATAWRDNGNAVVHLLRLGANPNVYCQNSVLSHLCHMAASDALAELLAAGADPNGQDNDLHCPLVEAADTNNGVHVGLLLRAGARPDGNRMDLRPLDLAVRRGYTEAARLLIDAGAYLSPTVLISATKHRVHIVEQLLAAGVLVDAKDSQGNTALHYAVTRTPRAIGPLLAAGADVDAANSAGVTPRKLAERYPTIQRKYAELS